MADGGHADGLVIVCQLVDDAIGAHAQRAEAVQATAQGVSEVGVALEQSERILDGVDKRPIEVEQLLPRPPGENDLGHASVGCSTLGEFAAKVVQRDGIAPGQLGEPGFDR
jgi:hypothetical protein